MMTNDYAMFSDSTDSMIDVLPSINVHRTRDNQHFVAMIPANVMHRLGGTSRPCRVRWHRDGSVARVTPYWDHAASRADADAVDNAVAAADYKLHATYVLPRF